MSLKSRNKLKKFKYIIPVRTTYYRRKIIWNGITKVKMKF
jgi:hypothetical protein